MFSQRADVGLMRRIEVNGADWRAVVIIDQISLRVILRDYACANRHALVDLAEYLVAIARSESCGKVLAEVRDGDWQRFLGRGYTLEGLIPGYFRGDAAYVVAYYVDPERQAASRLAAENAVLEAALATPPACGCEHDAARFAMGPAEPADAEELAALYRAVFSSYPTPLHDPDHIRGMLASGDAVFRVVRVGEQVVSAAAAEADWVEGNAELSDCATLPAYRGQGLMAALLRDLQAETTGRGIGCVYSLARASSMGMNTVLARLGYRFRGRLLNNCHIMGGFEDMNIWVRL